MQNRNVMYVSIINFIILKKVQPFQFIPMKSPDAVKTKLGKKINFKNEYSRTDNQPKENNEIIKP